MDHIVDNGDGNDCFHNDNCKLRAITHRFEVAASDEMRDLPNGVRVLGSANAVRVKGEGGVLVGGSSLVLLSVSSSVFSVFSYHDASAAAILWTNFTNASWVPGE